MDKIFLHLHVADLMVWNSAKDEMLHEYSKIRESIKTDYYFLTDSLCSIGDTIFEPLKNKSVAEFIITKRKHNLGSGEWFLEVDVCSTTKATLWEIVDYLNQRWISAPHYQE